MGHIRSRWSALRLALSVLMLSATFSATPVALQAGVPLAADKWELMDTSAVAPDWSDAAFVTASKGWVVGEAGRGARTTDGGTTWTPLTVNGNGWNVNDACFTTETTGYAVCDYGAISKTSNGIDWTFSQVSGSEFLYGVDFPTADVGMVTGASGALYTTANGGATWTKRDTGLFVNYADVSMPTATNAWIVATGGVIRATSDAGVTWGAQTSGVGVELKSVFFRDASTGWASGAFGRVLRTTDGGSTWSSVTIDTGLTVNDVWFVSAAEGYAACSNGALYRSDDGGANWMLVTTASSALSGGLFTSGTTGWIVGADGYVAKTTDSAGTWSRQKYGLGWALYDVTDASGWKCWAVGEGATVMKSTDSGDHWSKVDINISPIYSLHGVDFYGSSAGYVVGGSGAIARTTNGGESWETSTWVKPTTFYDVEALDQTTAFVVGGQGNILKTTDNGVTWQSQIPATPSTPAFHDIEFCDASNGYAVGANGLVGRTTDGGSTWTTQTVPLGPSIFGVAVLSPTNAWFVGSAGVMCHTTDGTTWTGPGTGWGTLTDIEFIDDQNGWVLSEAGVVYTTSNGGGDWTATPGGPGPAGTLSWALGRPASGAAWIVGSGGLLMHYDSIAPTTACALSPDVEWSNTPVQVTLTPSDAGGDYTRIQSTTVELSGATTQSATAYGAPFAVSNEGETLVEYSSTDILGNVEATVPVTVKVDSTIPSVTCPANTSYTGSANLTVSGNDALSGIARLSWRVDGGATQTVVASSRMVSALLGSVSVSGTGAHSVVCWSRDNAGNDSAPLTRNFTISPPPPAASALAISASPVNPAYGAASTLSATLTNGSGAGISGATVTFQRQYGGAWTNIGTAVTDSSGKATKSTVPYRYARSVYRAYFSGSGSYLSSESGQVAVSPKAYLSTPVAPTTMYKTRYYSVYGYIKPAHTVGTYPVRIYKQRYVSGRWVSYGYVNAKASAYSGYTKYTGSVKLPYAGRWRLRAYHADSLHAANYSSYRYVTVR